MNTFSIWVTILRALRLSVVSRWLGVALPSLLILLVMNSALFAHPEGFSGLQVTVQPDHLHVSITLHTRDLGDWFPAGKYPDYVKDVSRELERTVNDIVELQFDGEPLKFTAVKVTLLEVGLLELALDCPFQQTKPVELLVWSKHLIFMPRGHQQLLFVEDRRGIPATAEHGELRLEDVLASDRDASAVELPVVKVNAAADAAAAVTRNPAPVKDESSERPRTDKPEASKNDAEPAVRQPKQSGKPAGISFFKLGVEHIITGYDHLLFLAALLLTCKKFHEAATIITCFTVAHSITLALAALDIVRLSAAVVEPAIALTIIYVAIENLTTKPPLWRRALITGFFGLVHGLGFASVLRDLGLGSLPGGIVWPLLKFNLGVEAGQLCVAGLFLPLLLLLSRREEQWQKYWLPGLSLIVALLGAYWFVIRIAAQFSAV